MPHPAGRIAAEYALTKNHLAAIITLPKGVSGTFTYAGQTESLVGGENVLKLERQPEKNH